MQGVINDREKGGNLPLVLEAIGKAIRGYASIMERGQ
jgi:hypothetical protein